MESHLVCLLLAALSMSLPGQGQAQNPTGGPESAPGELRSWSQLLQLADRIDLNVGVVVVTPDSERGKSILEVSDSRIETVNFPRVVETDNGRELQEWLCSGEALAALHDAEEAFGQKDYAGARVGYRKVLRADPDCYMAHAHLGDTFFREDNFAASIPHYSRAIEINPDDHRIYVYRGHALLRVGQGDKALADFREALTLRPHYWLVEQLVDHYQDFGVVMNDLRVLFPVAVEVRADLDQTRIAPRKSRGKRSRKKARTDPDVQIFVISQDDDTERLAQVMTIFTAYGICQGIWEIESRTSAREPTPSPEAEPRSLFDSLREQECLAVALTSYESVRNDSDAATEVAPGFRDPTLDLLLEARDQGFLADAVLYGVAGPRLAHIPILMGDEVRASQRKFVEKFVLLRSEALPKRGVELDEHEEDWGRHDD